LVFDPGSTDGSVEIAKGYNDIELILGQDSGQSDAINKGLKRAKGDIVAWINSDDYYADESVFETVMKRFNEPDQPDIVYGKGIYVDEQKKYLRDVYINKFPDTLSWRLQQEDGILQPALFFRRDILDAVGYLTENLHFCMDYELWIRCVQKGLKFAYIDNNLSVARYHINNKTYGLRDKSYQEVMEMLHNRFGYVNHIWLRRFAEYLSEGFDGVLKHGGNQKIEKGAVTDKHYHNLLKAYNTDFYTMKLLNSKSKQKGYGDTLRELKKLNIGNSTPCDEVPIDSGYIKNKVCYTVGERRWAFDAGWKQKQIEKTHRFLDNEIKNRDKDACIIVGNGPSLKETDFKLFAGQDVIVSNNAFLNPDLIKYAKYYTVVNYLVAEQGFYNINQTQDVKKIIPYWLSYCINEDKDTYFIDAVGYPEFSTNIYKNVSWRHTVSFFNMHIAFGLGYKKAILVGFDHSYQQSKNLKEGEIIHNNDDDENHFCAEYFKGKKWQAADVDKMEEMYVLARDAFEKNDREIVNCTVGGCLELFRRGDLKDELKKSSEQPVKKNVTNISIKNDSAIPEKVICGPFNRNLKIHIDESEILYKLIDHIKNGKMMIDVGAHHGHSLMPYAKDGWTIHAFEPDPKNRKILKSRTVDYKNIHINKNAVSDEVRKEQCFYQSEESTGISSLLPFNDSHQEICKVDTISLKEYCASQTIEKVDILKIDTEGNDLKVLSGFSWSKFKPSIILTEFEDLKTLNLGYEFQRHGEISHQ
jgi:FkbM family methyltransferase